MCLFLKIVAGTSNDVLDLPEKKHPQKGAYNSRLLKPSRTQGVGFRVEGLGLRTGAWPQQCPQAQSPEALKP